MNRMNQGEKMHYRYSKEKMDVIERAYEMGYDTAMSEIVTSLSPDSFKKTHKNKEDMPEFKIKRVEKLIDKHYDSSMQGICEADKTRLNDMKFEIRGD